MKLSLLDVVQTILSSLDSDEVNSLSDTVESRQVALVARTAYENIIARSDLPEHKGIFTLDAFTDANFPTIMLVPDDVLHIEWIKYNIEVNPLLDDNFKYITILPVQQFTDLVQQLNPSDPNVGSNFHGAYKFYYKTDTHPSFCTIINDLDVIFDAYDSSVDTTLQASKTMCYGLSSPTFQMIDEFVPDLDDQQFVLWLNEAKSLAFLELKQMPHAKADLEARRGWSSIQRTKYVNKPNAFD
jgi:hypothetical protein